MEKHINVYGAGLAGCEAAWQAASRGVAVTLYEMKPKKYTPAHHSEGYAELVCSNSLRSSFKSPEATVTRSERRELEQTSSA